MTTIGSTYLVQPLLTQNVAGAGGPNVVPHDDHWVAQCVARAPGGPTHVMLDDRIAEHVPGCNMAFRRDALLAIGGFNPLYLRAGDDVDVCWRLQAMGLRIGFAPSALVWHHHRASVSAFWRQQVGYGESEAWLNAHHPEKFVAGEMLWRGRIYSPLPFVRSLHGRRVNTGIWGTAAFPSVYSTRTHALQLLPHSAPWMIVSSVLVVASFLALQGSITTRSIDKWGAEWLLAAGILGWIDDRGALCQVRAPVGPCCSGSDRATVAGPKPRHLSSDDRVAPPDSTPCPYEWPYPRDVVHAARSHRRGAGAASERCVAGARDESDLGDIGSGRARHTRIGPTVRRRYGGAFLLERVVGGALRAADGAR